jgi:hypothetical protein|tara:strand:- start:327 stop:1328 length:1002 start_codon:yes stop_codon:yes gene_type:complete
MLYQRLIKLLNEKKFSEIEEICQNNKTSIDKNEDLLAIYGTALFNQNKNKLALSVFRKAYSISTKIRNTENLAKALHGTNNFEEASNLLMKLSMFWKNVKIKNHKRIEKNEGFLIFGLQRSGTNLLSDMLTRSFSSLENSFYQINERRFDSVWKHSIHVPTIYIDCPLFIIFKNPYKWVESICLRNYADILSRQATYPIDEKEGFVNDALFGKNKFNLENLGKLYSHFFESWIVNQNKNIKQKIIVNYEDLLEKEKREIFYDKISKKFNINLNILTDPISLVGQVYQSKNYSSKNFDNYDESSKLQLNKENLSVLNSNLNDLIFDTLGYKKIF